MSDSPFTFDRVDDLVLPRPDGTTGRALASAVRRRLFERLKTRLAKPHLLLPELDTLREAVGRRLPGSPHEISDALREPWVTVPLARGLAGDPAALGTAISRMLIALGDVSGDLPRGVTVHGAIRLYDDPLLAFWADADVLPPHAPSVQAARAALDLLRTVAPALCLDAERFAVTLLRSSTPSHALHPTCIGLTTLPHVEAPGPALEALLAGIAAGKLRALADGHLDPARISEVAVAAGAASYRHVARALAARGVTLDGGPDEAALPDRRGDAFDPVVDELERLGADAR